MRKLNETFLQTSPGAYFRERAYALMSEHSGPPIVTVTEQPVPAYRATYARVDARLGKAAAAIGHLADTALPSHGGDTTHALAIFMTAHHAYESLVRSVLAFSDSRVDSSPWLYLSGRSTHRKSPQFPERVRDLLSRPEEDLATIIQKLVYGAPAVMEQIRTSGQDPSPRVVHVISWVRHAAEAVLQNANAYNAAKHGLASTSSFSRIGLVLQEPPTDGESEGQTLLHEAAYLAGPNIETLEVRRDGDDKVWRNVVRVIDPVAEVCSTLIIAEILDATWEIGRAVYLEKRPITVSFLAGPTPSEVSQSADITTGVLDMPLGVRPLDRSAGQKVLRRLVNRDRDDVGETPPTPTEQT